MAVRDPRTNDAPSHRSAPTRHRPRDVISVDETSSAAQASIHHPAADSLTRNPQTITLGQLLGRQGRSEVRIVLTNQRYRVIANAVTDPVVRRSADGLVPDRRSTTSPDSVQQSADLTLTQVKHMCR